jgi:predicted DNA-binding transcriptional regulator YafY
MNRTDRLLAIVLELQGKRLRRAEDLARTFETSKRTIYRDLFALGQAGVPIVSTPGRGYSLMEGYFLPPLSFTADEATILLLGSDVMVQSFDAQYREAAQAAGRKITGVLPERLRDEVAALRQSIHFGFQGAALPSALAGKLHALRRAILDRVTVRFRYHTRRPDEPSGDEPSGDEPSGDEPSGDEPSGDEHGMAVPRPRDADPYALRHLGTAWYLAGYCHRRHEVRQFRLDRIEDLVLLDTVFQRPTPADPRGYAPSRRNPRADENIEVRALFDASVARWVREAPSFFAVAEEETPEGLLVTLRIRRADDVLQWLLGWGRHVRVVSPEAMRRQIAEEANALLDHHGSRISERASALLT